MCSTCGCDQSDNKFTLRAPGEDNLENQQDFHKAVSHDHDHHHHHGHDNHHHHDHNHGGHIHRHDRTIEVEQDILHKNNLLAERNRGYLDAKNIVAFNLVSSPGAGKTSLLERTIKDLGLDLKLFVIEGDQQTMNDAERIAAAGAPVVQINTGLGCHLDAEMVSKAIKKLQPAEGSLLFIENVGNLVCPSLFDLGETKRVLIMSVTEGDDKPLKYPTMFQTSHLCIINKTDLAPYVDFDMAKAKEYALRVNHHLEIIEVSVKTGEGMELWYEWLKRC
jgi:hydrogenase nickel incorporation protein HypB